MINDVGVAYKTGNMAETDDEPGSVDNRLTLNLGDDRWKDVIGEWQDGKQYQITGGTIRQIQPGEFEVVGIQFAEGDGSEQEPDKGEGNTMGADEGGTQEGGTQKSARYSNPALDNI